MNAINGDNMLNPNHSAHSGENPDREKSIMLLDEDEEHAPGRKSRSITIAALQQSKS
jgi:hypothetical protein